MVEIKYVGEALWDRMERAVEKVNERLRKTVAILEASGIPYAVVGGHAVRAWVAQVDEAAVRITRDVDIMIEPENLPALKVAMEAGGFHYRETAGVPMFVEHPDGSAKDAVHVILTGEMIRLNDFEANPDLSSSMRSGEFQTLSFESLVRMKLNSFRLKDRVHILDMISVGLIDESWLAKFPGPLRDRLQELLDNPDG
jgi:hypothetical protein